MDADAEQFTALFENTFKDRKDDTVLRSQFLDVAGSIRDGNRSVTREQAALMAQTAMDPRATPRVLRDGRVQIDPRLPAVFMSEDAMLQLAALQGRARTSGGTRSQGPSSERGSAQPATAGATAPVTGTPPGGANTTTQYASPARRRMEADEAVRAERQRALPLETLQRKRETKKSEYDQLVDEIGPEEYAEMERTAPGGVVTLKMLREALNDRTTERGVDLRRSRARGLGNAIRRDLDERYGGR